MSVWSVVEVWGGEGGGGGGGGGGDVGGGTRSRMYVRERESERDTEVTRSLLRRDA